LCPKGGLSMTVLTTTSIVSYLGNGATTVFDFDFLIPDGALVVTVEQGGVVSVLEASDYGVSGLGNANGGVVTFATAPASGVAVTISRSLDILQDMAFVNGSAFYAEVIEGGFDKLTMIAQDLQEQVDRSVKVSITSQETPETIMETLLAARDQSVSASASATVSQGAAAVSAASAVAADAGAAASAAAVATDRAVVEVRAAEVATHWAEVESAAAVVAASETAAVTASTSAQADAATAQAASDSAEGAAGTASAAAVLAGASADAAAVSEGNAEGWAAQAAASASTASAAGGGTVTQITTGAGLTGGPVTVSGEIAVAAGGISTALLADGAVTAAKIADASVSLAKLAPSGTAAQVLTSQGAGLPPVFADAGGGGGAWVLIGSAVASSSATLTVTGLDSTFSTYAIALSDIKPASDGAATPYMRVGDASSIKTSGYVTSIENNDIYGTTYNRRVNITDKIPIGPTTSTTGNVGGEGFGGVFFLHRPGNGNIFPLITGQGAYMNSSQLYFGNACAYYGTVISLDRVQFFFDSGNVLSGRFTVWGINHA
jgi:hypothetical protein